MIRYSIDGNGPRPYTSTEIRLEREGCLDNSVEAPSEGGRDISRLVGLVSIGTMVAIGISIACSKYGHAIYDSLFGK
jgi:hypothetical protein